MTYRVSEVALRTIFLAVGFEQVESSNTGDTVIRAAIETVAAG